MNKPLLIIGNKNYSSWSLRPWLVMKHAGIDFDERVIPLDQDDTKERILTHSPAGRVPVLIGEDGAIWESLAIMEHIAEDHPSLWPRERSARARARSITAEMHAGFETLRALMPMNCRARGRHVAMTDALGADIRRVVEIWRDVRQEFGGTGPWLFGGFSIADAMFAPVASRLSTYNVALDGTVAMYAAHWHQDDHMRAWIDAARSEPWLIEHDEIGM